jgi:hypothetical protein
MTTTTPDEKILDRVAKLLAIAEHPNTPEHEADVALTQATKLMAKHAIEEAMLRQSQTTTERLVKRTIVIGRSEFSPYLNTILIHAAKACRVSIADNWNGGDVYGADEDVAWLDMLFNMIKLQFLLKLDPKWDDSKDYNENVYNFKVAGYAWKDINRVAISHGQPDKESVKIQDHLDEDSWQVRYSPEEYIVKDGKVYRRTGFYHNIFGAYKRHAKKIGDTNPVATQNHQAYRLSFAESFRSTMVERLRKMADDAEREMDTIPGAALAIADVREEANRMMWAEHPSLDPEEIARRRKAYEEQERREAEARQAKLDAMTPAQRRKFLEDEEKAYRRGIKAANRGVKYYTYDAGARARGAKAAQSVDLSRKAGSAGGGSTRKEIG